MTEQDRFDVVSLVAETPDLGSVIRETGGVRKFRFAGRGHGKSGGYRVISFFTGRTCRCS